MAFTVAFQGDGLIVGFVQFAARGQRLAIEAPMPIESWQLVVVRVSGQTPPPGLTSDLRGSGG
ncbi:MAG TPA: hypothetical protein VG247_35705 [Pseudonocardiaceae bacterium]|nr:hypothetical protein [Pseudonocardiaceae bacterium]